jgi:geranylgeranyl transferase type-2 subunit alpha
MQAMYTMPSDQSAWLYHRWLVAQSTLMGFAPGSYRSSLTYSTTAKDPEVVKREIKLIQELLDEEPDSKCG